MLAIAAVDGKTRGSAGTPLEVGAPIDQYQTFAGDVGRELIWLLLRRSLPRLRTKSGGLGWTVGWGHGCSRMAK